MIRNVTPADRAPSFPLTVKKGHASVKIYEVRNRERTNYTVSYVGVKGRIRKTFADFENAEREANAIAEKLADGDMQALKLTGREKQIYVEAERALKDTGMQLDAVARDFARAFKILGHDGIIEAVRYFKKKVETGLPPMRVADAVARYSEAKGAEGLSEIYMGDIRKLLRPFAAAFNCNIATVQTDDIRAYLNHMNVGHVTRNNHRRVIGGLFSFARDQGWLPPNQKTAVERLKAYKVKQGEIEIFTPIEVAKLLAHADEDFLPWVALIAFGGIRNEELHKGLMWEAINFHQGYLIVPAGIAKTGRKRKIELPENLLEWLAPYRNRRGAIFARDYRKPKALMCKAAGVTWKVNGLRHSFGSYRLEAVKNEGQVALEMGNSAGIVKRHYADVVTAAAAREYWSITPIARGSSKVVQMA
ncbi:MAG: site-specific integrase [Chthoniobacterales bacterium]|nr:site-specific integrase [Chthoniobacterales bacterium]